MRLILARAPGPSSTPGVFFKNHTETRMACTKKVSPEDTANNLLQYNEEDKAKFKSHFILTPSPAKRPRGRPKGTTKKKRGGNHKKTKTPGKKNTQIYLKVNDAEQSIDLTEQIPQDKLVEECLPKEKAKSKQKRNNWRDPDKRKYLLWVCRSWMAKNDLCTGDKESMATFSKR